MWAASLYIVSTNWTLSGLIPNPKDVLSVTSTICEWTPLDLIHHTMVVVNAARRLYHFTALEYTLQTGLNRMKWSFLFLLTTCSCPDVDVYLPCFVLPPVSVPHHVVLSPQLLYPSDSRQCVLRPPTWHSSQGPQGVCVFVSVCALISFFCICPHLACNTCSSHARAHCHFVCACVADLLVPAVRPSICLFFSSLACLPVFRLCIWDCFCTISDGLKEKPESLQTPHLDACESGL